MGYYIYPPKPGAKDARGEEIGPCIGDCQHKDCAGMRADALKTCRICGKPIGFGNPVYFEGGDNTPTGKQMVHAHCLWEESERGHVPEK